MYIGLLGSNFDKALSAARSSSLVNTPKSSYNSCDCASLPLNILLPAPGGAVFNPPSAPPNFLNKTYAGLTPKKALLIAASNTAASIALDKRDLDPSGLDLKIAPTAFKGFKSAPKPSSLIYPGLFIPSAPNVNLSGKFSNTGSTVACNTLSKNGDIDLSITSPLSDGDIDM